MEESREPKFMREIHKIKAELPKMPPTEYEKHLKEVKDSNEKPYPTKHKHI